MVWHGSVWLSWGRQPGGRARVDTHSLLQYQFCLEQSEREVATFPAGTELTRRQEGQVEESSWETLLNTLDGSFSLSGALRAITIQTVLVGRDNLLN